MSHNEGNLLYDLLRPIFCLQTIGTKLQIRLCESLIGNVVYLLNDHKVNHFFSIRQIFHYFFTEVALSVSRMARLLFLLFVFDTSKNVLQRYYNFSEFARFLAKKIVLYTKYLLRNVEGCLFFRGIMEDFCAR